MSRGHPGRLGWGAALAAILIGGAVGGSAAMPSPVWLRVPTPGPVSLGFGVAGGACLLLSVITRSVRLRRAAAEAELLRTTDPVTAVVTDQGHSGDGDWTIDGDPVTSPTTIVTYRFTDRQGTDRWIRRMTTMRRHEALMVGDEVDLWFNPDKPGDTASIVIRRR